MVTCFLQHNVMISELHPAYGSLKFASIDAAKQMVTGLISAIQTCTNSPHIYVYNNTLIMSHRFFNWRLSARIARWPNAGLPMTYRSSLVEQKKRPK